MVREVGVRSRSGSTAGRRGGGLEDGVAGSRGEKNGGGGVSLRPPQSDGHSARRQPEEEQSHTQHSV